MYNIYMSEWESGVNQLTDPIKDTLLHLPRETLRAGRELATESPRKAFRTIANISLGVVRMPLLLLLNVPLLPTGITAGQMNANMQNSIQRQQMRNRGLAA